LQRDVERGAKTVMDEYGATNPAEFFAVATETFFEKATSMQRHHPELYAVLQRYYRLDPVSWSQPR
jgi:Mlc titration factor MtfA (ptsG expression regulator)